MRTAAPERYEAIVPSNVARHPLWLRLGPEARRAIDILDVILRDEIGHVAIGNRWYAWLCERQGLEPVAHYRVLVRRHEAPRLRPPFNEVARKAAGFSQQELDYLLGA